MTDPSSLNYGGNSQRSKQTPPTSNRPEIVPITTSVTFKKKSLGRKFKETFAGSDARSTGNYLFLDVIVPTIKNLLFDMLSQGAQRMLFGTATPNRSYGGSSVGSRTGYQNTVYKASDAVRVPNAPAKERTGYEFREIVVGNSGEAHAILDQLRTLIEDYHSATVADLYACVDKTAEFTDQARGWTDLSNARVVPVNGGYLIELPEPVILNTR